MNLKSKILLIDSKDRTRGAAGDFRYTLKSVGLKDTMKFKITKVIVPYSFYSLPAQSFEFTEASIAYTVNMPAGNFTSSEFAATLINQIAASGAGGTYTVVYDQVTGHFTVSSGGVTFKFDFSNQYTDARNIGIAMGMVIDPNYVIPIVGETADVTSSWFANLSVYAELYIDCPLLDNDVSAYFNKSRQSIIQAVPINVNRGSYIIWQNSTDQYHQLKSNYLETFQIRLINKFNDVIDLNGLDWEMEIFFIED